MSARHIADLGDLLTVKEIAAVFDTSEHHVYELVYKKRLKAINIGGGETKACLRVTKTALLEFLGEEVSK